MDVHLYSHIPQVLRFYHKLLIFLFQPTIKYLGQILTELENASTDFWQTGNCILAVCHSILLHHDTAKIIKGELLLLFIDFYNKLLVIEYFVRYYQLLYEIQLYTDW